MRMLQNSVKVKRNRKYINITKQDLHHMFLFPFFPCFQDGMDLLFGCFVFFFFCFFFSWNIHLEFFCVYFYSFSLLFLSLFALNPGESPFKIDLRLFGMMTKSHSISSGFSKFILALSDHK